MDTATDIEEQDVQTDQEQQPKPKLKVREFAAKIKAKYPEYKDIDDDELTKKIVAKYPDYKDQIDFTVEVKKKEPVPTASPSSGTDLVSVSPTQKEPSESDKILNPFQGIKEYKQKEDPYKDSPFSIDKNIHPKENPIPGYTRPADLDAAHDEDKSVMKNLWNSFTNGIGRLGASGADLSIQALNKILPSEEGVTDEQRLKKLREDVVEPTRTATTELVGANVTEKQKEAFNKNLLTSTAGGLVEMIPAMGGRGLGLVLQAYDHGMESINSSEEGKKLPENVKTVFSGTVGAVVGAMDRLSLTKIFGKSSGKVATNVAVKVLSNLVEKADAPITAEVAQKAIMAELKSLKNVAINSGKKLAQSALIQGEAMAGIEGVNMLAEKIVNKSQDKEVFQEHSWKENLTRLAEAGLHGAVGGVMLGAASLPLNRTTDYISERVTNAKSPEDIVALKDEIMKTAAKKGLNEQETINLSETVDNYIKANQSVPVEIPNRKEVMDKIVEGDGLQKELDSKHEELAKADDESKPEIKTDIEALNKRMDEITEEIKQPENISNDEPTTGITNQPLSTETKQPEGQEIKGEVPTSTESVSSGGAEATTPVLEPHPEVVKLEAERDAKVKELEKPKVDKLEYIKEEELVKKPNETELIEEQRDIKKRESRLKKIIECLTS